MLWTVLGLALGVFVASGVYCTAERYHGVLMGLIAVITGGLFYKDISIGLALFVASISVFIFSCIFGSIFSPEADKEFEKRSELAKAEWERKQRNKIPNSELQAMQAGRWAAYFTKH